MTTLERRCVICGATYTTPHARQVTCGSSECTKENLLAVAKRNSKKRRAKAVASKSWRKPIKCRICGKEFVRERWNQNTCPNKECKRLSKNWNQTSSPNMEQKVCKCCGVTYTPRTRNQTVCGSDRCVRWRKNQRRGQQLAVSKVVNSTPVQNFSTFGQYAMPCPWESHKLGTMPLGVTSWSDPIMDPLSGLFPMRTFSVPNVAREVAA